MLIAEDLLLLLTDDTNGKLSAPAREVEIVLTGANLVQLALMGRVDISRAVEPVRLFRIEWIPVERLIVRDRSPTGDAVLDATLQTVIREQGPPIHAVIRQSGKKVRKTLCERLVSMGMVRYERRRILGVERWWPAQDSHHKADVRRRVIQALVYRTTPDPRTAVLIALVHTIDKENRVVGGYLRYGIRFEQLVERGEEIAATNDFGVREARNKIGALIAAIRRAVLSTRN